MILSPLTIKRLKAFKRIKRAWYSLLILGVIFVFCLAADWVCPCDPCAVVETSALEKYVERAVEEVSTSLTARWNEDSSGARWNYEGPADLDLSAYDVTRTPRAGYVRVFAVPRVPPPVETRVLPPPPVTYPFRPVWEHPFGIDAGGRDVYARVVHGLKIALLFGLALALSGMLIGLLIGAVEGYFGGKTDLIGQRLTEIWSAIPFLYVMIFIGSTVGRSFSVLLVCYAIFNWIAVSYYMRAEFLRLRSHTFVDAARVQGFSSARIIFSEILPNALTPLITLFPFLLMSAIASLAALDFLGFGLPPMTPSCGELMQEAQQFREAWWLILFPASALFIVMLLTVFVGEGLRDAFDPRQQSKLE